MCIRDRCKTASKWTKLTKLTHFLSRNPPVCQDWGVGVKPILAMPGFWTLWLLQSLPKYVNLSVYLLVCLSIKIAQVWATFPCSKNLNIDYVPSLLGFLFLWRCSLNLEEELKAWSQLNNSKPNYWQVLPCCGKKYQQRRLVNNRACIARWAHRRHTYDMWNMIRDISTQSLFSN